MRTHYGRICECIKTASEMHPKTDANRMLVTELQKLQKQNPPLFLSLQTAGAIR